MYLVGVISLGDKVKIYGPLKTDPVFRFQFYLATNKTTTENGFSVGKHLRKPTEQDDVRISVHSPDHSSLFYGLWVIRVKVSAVGRWSYVLT